MTKSTRWNLDVTKKSILATCDKRYARLLIASLEEFDLRLRRIKTTMNYNGSPTSLLDEFYDSGIDVLLRFQRLIEHGDFKVAIQDPKLQESLLTILDSCSAITSNPANHSLDDAEILNQASRISNELSHNIKHSNKESIKQEFGLLARSLRSFLIKAILISAVVAGIGAALFFTGGLAAVIPIGLAAISAAPSVGASALAFAASVWAPVMQFFTGVSATNYVASGVIGAGVAEGARRIMTKKDDIDLDLSVRHKSHELDEILHEYKNQIKQIREKNTPISEEAPSPLTPLPKSH